MTECSVWCGVVTRGAVVLRQSSRSQERLTDCDVAGQRLRFYCVQCDTAVCSSCTDIEHREHTTDSLQQAMKTERETMRTSVADIQEKVPNIKKSIETIKLTSESLAHKEEDLDDDISKGNYDKPRIRNQ